MILQLTSKDIIILIQQKKAIVEMEINEIMTAIKFYYYTVQKKVT